LVVGEIRETFCIYSDSIGNEMGTIGIGDTGLVIKTTIGENYMVPYEYVKSVVTEGGVTLGKMKAVLVFHDVMGDRHELVFMASDMKLAELKRACEK